MAIAAAMLWSSRAALACIGRDGTLPIFGGSGPNPIALAQIESAWKGARAAGLKAPPLPPVSGVHPTVIVLVENAAGGAAFRSGGAAWAAARLSSIANYYTQVSRGLFTISAAAESHGTSNDGVIGPVTIAGLSGSSDISSGSSEALAVQAIQAINPSINFASFDTNVNGVIESNELHILIYQAGNETSYGGGALPRAWAHMRWRTPQLSGLTPSTDSDNKSIQSYCYCGSEFNGVSFATMGQMTHELGHDLGLPDLYDADGAGSGGDWDGLGDHCLMASGSWGTVSVAGDSPSHLDGFMKNRLGWANATTLSVPGDTTVNLNAANGSNDILVVNPVIATDEFFVIENRQQTGYDAGLPGSSGGLIIYHCDGGILTDSNIRVTNNVNRNPTDYGIAVDEADGNNELGISGGSRGSDTDYFRAGGNTAFHDASTPNSRTKSGASTDMTVSNISASGAVMSLTLGTGHSAVGPSWALYE